MISYQISKSTNLKLRKLANKFADIYSEVKLFSLDEKDAIHRYARISMIGASTRISNATLRDQEIEWIDSILSQNDKLGAYEQSKIFIHNQLVKNSSIEEVAGCRAMLLLIYEQANDMLPLTETAIRGLHCQLMRYYSNASMGQYRSLYLELMEYYSNIGSYMRQYKVQPNDVAKYSKQKTRMLFKTAPSGPIIQSSMSDLVSWYNQAITSQQYSIGVSCEFVFRFLAIHPFVDGNGKLGRALFLLSMLQSVDITISSIAHFLAIDRHIEKHKEEYYAVLNLCSGGAFSNDPTTYNIEYFLLFMIKILEESLDDIAIYRTKYQSLRFLSDSAIKVLACFKERPELRLNTALICKATLLPRRTVINALNSLLLKELVQKYGKGSAVKYQLVF
jgi:hypothetical protein